VTWSGVVPSASTRRSTPERSTPARRGRSWSLGEDHDRDRALFADPNPDVPDIVLDGAPVGPQERLARQRASVLGAYTLEGLALAADVRNQRLVQMPWLLLGELLPT
jgi:hypothetical protein